MLITKEVILNIAMLNDWLHGGGAERSMVYIANEISERNDWPIDIYCLEGGNSYSLSKSVHHRPIRAKFSSKLHKLCSIFQDAVYIKRQMSLGNVDILLSFQLRSNIVNILSKMLGSKHKVVISERVYANDFYRDVWYSPIAFLLIRFFYNKADLITCNADDIKRGLRKLGINIDIEVINNGYPKSIIRDLANKKITHPVDNFEVGKISLVSIGRLAEQKGHRYLLEALSCLPPIEKNKFRLLIIGDGPLKNELESLLTQFDLNEIVKLIPYSDNPYYYLKKSDFLVLPSLYEGFPNVICESLIVGTPVLAFDFKSGASDLVTKSNGRLVKKLDIEALSKALVEFDFDSYHVDSSIINTVAELGDKYQKVFESVIK